MPPPKVSPPNPNAPGPTPAPNAPTGPRYFSCSVRSQMQRTFKLCACAKRCACPGTSLNKQVPTLTGNVNPLNTKDAPDTQRTFKRANGEYV